VVDFRSDRALCRFRAVKTLPLSLRFRTVKTFVAAALLSLQKTFVAAALLSLQKTFVAHPFKGNHNLIHLNSFRDGVFYETKINGILSNECHLYIYRNFEIIILVAKKVC